MHRYFALENSDSKMNGIIYYETNRTYNQPETPYLFTIEFL